jgi:hypothetical protein
VSVPVGRVLRVARGVVQGGQRLARGGVLEAVIQHLIVKPAQFGRTAGLADEAEPGAGAVAGDRFRGEALGQVTASQVGLDGAQGEFELFLLRRCFRFPLAGFERAQERSREIIDCEPGGVVEEWIQRLIDDAKGERRALRQRYLGQSADGLHAHAGMFVHHPAREGARSSHGVAQKRRPRGRLGGTFDGDVQVLRKDPHGGGADGRVLRFHDAVEVRRGLRMIDALGEADGGEGCEIPLVARAPSGERLGHGVVRAFQEHPSRLGAIESIRGKLLIQQFLDRCLREVARFRRRSALPRHAPDPAVRAVAPRIAEIHFAMLNDRIAPVRDVNRAVRAQLHVDRAKGARGGAEEVGLLFRHVAGAGFAHAEARHAVGAKIARDETAPATRAGTCRSR